MSVKDYVSINWSSFNVAVSVSPRMTDGYFNKIYYNF
jgi:hypothetical protein